MKTKLLFCFLLLISLNCYANGFPLNCDTAISIKQTKKIHVIYHVVVSREHIKGYRKKFDNCLFTGRYTLAQRLKTYPYSKASKIMAVAYFGGGEPNREIRIDTPERKLSYEETQHYKGLVIENQQLDYSTLMGAKILNKTQIEELTNIVFNYEYSGMKNYPSTGFAVCFDPRNSIIFFDKDGKIFDHLDICFACHRYDSQSRKLGIGTECTQKFDMPAKFFIKSGVPYGTTPETYSGREE
ncbi:MAG TPA: hypothetical protein VIM77_11305 [Mucilaginibacter sp.]